MKHKKLYRKPVYTVGQKYGRFTILERPLDSNGNLSEKVKVKCECGTVKYVYIGSLGNGTSKGCNKCKYPGRTKHGMAKERIYNIWQNMKRRCTDPNNQDYKNYGGRGISFDPRWEKFEEFYNDMKFNYADNLTLERIDVNANYYKSNCKWIPNEDQAINKTNNIRLMHDGKLMSLGQISKITGVNSRFIYQRVIIFKWSLEEALSIPKGIKRSTFYNRKQ